MLQTMRTRATSSKSAASSRTISTTTFPTILPRRNDIVSGTICFLKYSKRCVENGSFSKIQSWCLICTKDQVHTPLSESGAVQTTRIRRDTHASRDEV